MPQRRLTIYGAIALATPLLVLANALLGPGGWPRSGAVTPLRPLLGEAPSLGGAVPTLAMAHRAWRAPPEARIILEAGQPFLEFYTPFHLSEHGPGLALFLVAEALPAGGNLHSPLAPPGGDEHYPSGALGLGAMHPTAGRHRYPIPAATDLGQYRALVLWCGGLNAVIGYAPLAVARPPSSIDGAL